MFKFFFSKKKFDFVFFFFPYLKVNLHIVNLHIMMKLHKISTPILLLVVAVITQILQRAWQSKMFKNGMHLSSDSSLLSTKSIFIAIIAYKDTKWNMVVNQILNHAKVASRIHIGILYYTQDLNLNIPNSLMHRVRMHYIVTKKAVPMQESRKLCIKYLYHNEDYCIFAKSFVPIVFWDEYFIERMGPRKIISMPFGEKTRATFPILERDKHSFTYKYLHTEQKSLIHSIAWCSDFSMCDRNAVSLICSADTEWGVSAVLVYNGYTLYVPGKYTASRTEHPHSVRLRKIERRVSLNIQKTYKSWLSNHNAKLGLLKHMTSVECIAKYGSVASAHMRISNS